MAKIALIDGDVVAYGACRSRYMTNNGLIQVNELTTDLETGKHIIPDFTEEQDNIYLKESWEHFQKDLREIQETVFAEFAMTAVKGADNFREAIYPEYKANRHRSDPKRRNAFVPIIRQLAVNNGLAVEATGREADDLLRIWSEECKKNGDEFIICSLDKDLKCIAGQHYLIHKNEFITVTEIDAERFFYEQLLKGDPSDNIKGIPGVGPKTAEKFLKDATTVEEFQELVSFAYYQIFDKNWRNELLLNGKLLYIQKSFEDYFTLDNWKLHAECISIDNRQEGSYPVSGEEQLSEDTSTTG